MAVSGTSAAPSPKRGFMDEAKAMHKGMGQKAKDIAIDAVDYHKVITCIGLAALSTLLILGMAGVVPLPSEAISQIFGGNEAGTMAATLTVLAAGGMAYLAYKYKDKSKFLKVVFLIAVVVVAILGASLMAKDQHLGDLSSYGPIFAHGLAIGSGALAIGIAGASFFKTGSTTNKVLAVVAMCSYLFFAMAVSATAYNSGEPGSFLVTAVGTSVGAFFVYDYAKKLFNKRADVFSGMQKIKPRPRSVVVGPDMTSGRRTPRADELMGATDPHRDPPTGRTARTRTDGRGLRIEE